MATTTLGIGGDNSISIQRRELQNYGHVIEVIEYSEEDRTVHLTTHSIRDAVTKANDIIREEATLAEIEHEYFNFDKVYEELVFSTREFVYQAERYSTYIKDLASYIYSIMDEGLIEGNTEIHTLLEILDDKRIAKAPKVKVRVEGTMTRTFTIDTEIEVLPWHAKSTAHIEAYYEDEIVSATDDDYDCSTEIDIDSVEEAGA
jgi:hypothetical protein